MGWGTKHDNFVTHQPNVELVADRIVSHLATMLATSNALNAVLGCPRPYEALMVRGGMRFLNRLRRVSVRMSISH